MKVLNPRWRCSSVSWYCGPQRDGETAMAPGRGSQTRSSECSWCRQPLRRSFQTGACRGGNARSRETRGSSASCISFLPERNLKHCKEWIRAKNSMQSFAYRSKKNAAVLLVNLSFFPSFFVFLRMYLPSAVVSQVASFPFFCFFWPQEFTDVVFPSFSWPSN